jgi:hypothetical protein
MLRKIDWVKVKEMWFLRKIRGFAGLESEMELDRVSRASRKRSLFGVSVFVVYNHQPKFVRNNEERNDSDSFDTKHFLVATFLHNNGQTKHDSTLLIDFICSPKVHVFDCYLIEF